MAHKKFALNIDGEQAGVGPGAQSQRTPFRGRAHGRSLVLEHHPKRGLPEKSSMRLSGSHAMGSLLSDNRSESLLPENPNGHSPSMTTDARQRFNGCAMRHIAAMNSFPDARALEVHPLSLMIPQSRNILLDLFAGTGLVAKSLGRFFDHTVLVDSCAALPEPVGPSANRICGDAICHETLDSLSQADMAVCLASFHHVLAEGHPRAGRGLHGQLKLDVLRAWRQKLRPGGRLIIADVPAPGTCIASVTGSGLGESSGPLAETGHRMEEGADVFVPARQCKTLGDYLAEVRIDTAGVGLKEPDPASFFDHIVSHFSPQGHVADFNTPDEMVTLFCEAGYENVQAFVAPTPWLFRNRPDALWFVHELLSLGRPCTSPAKLTGKDRANLERGIADYLDLRQLPDESWALSWKLMYVAGDRM